MASGFAKASAFAKATANKSGNKMYAGSLRLTASWGQKNLARACRRNKHQSSLIKKCAAIGN
jgi:hypothetical protein